MAGATPPEEVYEFSVPVIFKKRREGTLQELTPEEYHDVYQYMDSDGLMLHLKGKFPFLDIRSLSKFNIELSVQSQSQLDQIYQIAEKSDQQNELAKCINQYSDSISLELIAGEKLGNTLYVSAVMTKKQYCLGFVAFDDIDHDLGTTRAVPEKERLLQTPTLTNTTGSNTNVREREKNIENKNRFDDVGTAQSRPPVLYAGSYPHRPDSNIPNHIPMVEKTLIIYVHVNKHNFISDINLKSDDKRLDGLQLLPHGKEQNMYELCFKLPLSSLKSTTYFYEVVIQRYTQYFRVFSSSKPVTLKTELFHLTDEPLQRDIMKTNKFECTVAHLKDILFYSGDNCSDIKKHILEIENILKEANYNMNTVNAIFDKLLRCPFSPKARLLFLVVCGNLLINVNQLKLRREMNRETSRLFQMALKEFRLDDLPDSCQQYMVDICQVLSDIYFGDKNCFLLFMDACYPFLNETHLNKIILEDFKNNQYDLLCGNSADLHIVAKEMLLHLYTDHVSLGDRNKSERLVLLRRILFHLPIEFVLPIGHVLLQKKDTSPSVNEEDIRIIIKEIISNSIKREMLRVKRISSLKAMKEFWILVHTNKMTRTTIIEQFEKEILEMLKVYRNQTREDSRTDLRTILLNGELFDSESQQENVLMEIAGSSVECVHEFFIDCIKHDKFTITFQKNMMKMCQTWLKNAIGTHAKSYKCSELCGPYIALSKLCLVESFNTKAEVKDCMTDLIFRHLEKTAPETICKKWKLDDEIEEKGGKYVAEVFNEHVVAILKKYKSENPEELLRYFCTNGCLLVNSRPTAGAICQILNEILKLPHTDDIVDMYKTIVSQSECWKIIFKVEGKLKHEIESNANYIQVFEYIQALSVRLQNFKITYKFICAFQHSTGKEHLLELMHVAKNGSFDKIWKATERLFVQRLEDVKDIQEVLTAINEHLPKEVLPRGFCEMQESLRAYETNIENTMLAVELKSGEFQHDINEMVPYSNKLLKLVHSRVFWNVSLADIVKKYRRKSLAKPMGDIECDIPLLFGEEVVEYGTTQCSEQILTLLNVVLLTGGDIYRDKWQALIKMKEQDIAMSVCISMFDSADSVKEVEMAESFICTKIKDDIKHTLYRFGELGKIESTVDSMKMSLKAFRIADEKFTSAIESFELLRSGDISSYTFGDVGKALDVVFKIAEPLNEDAVTVLEAIGGASNLIDFLFTIVDEDIRNLIDAVEDISEQHVQETSVAALIEVKRFVQPALKSDLQNEANCLFDLITRQFNLSPVVNRTIPLKIEDCVSNLHNLKSLYNNVANRSEHSKETIKSIVNKGRFLFNLNQSGTDCDFTVTYTVKKRRKRNHSKASLVDLRSRALLLANKKESSSGIQGKEFALFVSYVDTCTDISELVITLHSTGNVMYKVFKQGLAANLIANLKQHLQSEYDKWCHHLKSMRATYYLANFLQGFQIHKLHTYLESYDKVQNVMTYDREAETVLKAIHQTIKLDDLEERYTELKDSQVCDEYSFLEHVCRALHECLENEEIFDRKLCLESVHRMKLEDVVHRGRLLVTQLDEASMLVVRTILTLYYNTVQRLPEADQLLFCSRQTRWEEIELLLGRCLGASAFYGKDILYCITNVELLPNEIQFKLVEALRNLKPHGNYLFAVVCRGSKHHPFIDELNDFICNVRPLSDKDIEDILRSECPNVTTITSEVAGLGKTTHIITNAYTIGQSKATLHISGPMTKDRIVKGLVALQVQKFNTLHIDIGSLASTLELDTFLFELIVLRYVSAEKSSIYLPTNYVSIEIANSLQDNLRKSLETAILFKREHLTWHNYDDYIVSNDINSPSQVVCHFLFHLRKGNLDSKDVFFSGSQTCKPMPSNACREILRGYFPSFSGISFSIVNTFLNVLADQLKKLSSSSFFRTSRIKDMIGYKSAPTVRSSLVQALVDVSKEFSSRSLDACRTTQMSTINISTQTEKEKHLSTAQGLAKRIEGMIRWEDSNHLMYVFHNQNIQTISPIYRDRTKVPRHIKALFESQMKKEMQDYKQMTQAELQTLLQKICRSNPKMLPDETLLDMSKNYVLTPDNVLKMVLIMLRIKAGIPVLIMGETGCGKTSLIRYLARICEVQFEVVNIHAGVEEKDIENKVLQCNTEAISNGNEPCWMFFDEINTSEYVGLISDIICHHNFNGKSLAPNLVVMGACNPYKLRSEKATSTAGLKGKIQTDELSRLVYRVLPLPEMLVDYVWDFGSLSEADESTYIDRMVEGVFPNDNTYNRILSELLSASQIFVRKHTHSLCSVSLRDVQRCKILTVWFMKILGNKTTLRPTLHVFNADKKDKAVILALAHCYHSRIPDATLRKIYREGIGEVFRKNNKPFLETDIYNVIKAEQEDILNRMDLPLGTAKNTALCENVFVLLVCILNKLPIFVVGKPGCSKSLSIQLIRNNLRGEDSKDIFFKTLPQLYCVSFQGSESSTSDGIIKVFKTAEKYQETNRADSVLSVVILDEIGLAEVSRFNPLKVLHNLLEPDGKDRPNVAVVGISNWSLDASKMNRAIHLSRPEMDAHELYETGKSISDSFVPAETSKVKSCLMSSFSLPQLKSDFQTWHIEPDLKVIAESYYNYTKKLSFQNFHGLRDFYSLVKFFTREVSGKPDMSFSDKRLTMITGIERNFGGLPEESPLLLSEFKVADMKQCCPVVNLIKSNIEDKLARHLMLITTGESVLGILEQTLSEIGRPNSEVIFGSQFEEDLTDDYNYRILNRIILCMEQGLVLILKDLENIYGSLYDMLNQNYTVIGKKRNCRVALGPYSNPICHVADSFRCIVLVDDSKLNYSDPPFLNRFEKQYMRFADIIRPDQRGVIQKLKQWVQDVSVHGIHGDFKEVDAFPIFSEDMVSSLILRNYTGESIEDEIFKTCKFDLLWIVKPEVIVRLVENKCENILYERDELVEFYMKLPVHRGINGLLEAQISNGLSKQCLMNIVFTNSNIHTKVLQNVKAFKIQIDKLGAFKSEKQLSSRMRTFWLESNTDILFLQCSAVDDQRHIMLAKSVIEKFRQDFLSTKHGWGFKHVYLIVHLDRIKGLSAILSQINFLSEWKLVTLDALEDPITPLPELCLQSLLEALQTKKPLNTYVKEQLFWSFTRIKYKQEGRCFDNLTSLITKLKNSDEFLRTLEELITYSVEKTYQGIDDRNWQVGVACNRKSLQIASSFIEALESHILDIITVPLAKYIFVMERELMLDTFFVDDKCSEDRRAVWRTLISHEEQLSIAKIPDESGPECYVCGATAIELKMPFSKYIFQAVEATSDEYLNSTKLLKSACGLDAEDCLPDNIMFELLKKQELIVDQALPRLTKYEYITALEDYFEDFCNITSVQICPSVVASDRIRYAKMILANKTSFIEKDLLEGIVYLHIALWNHLNAFSSHMQLFETCRDILTMEDFQMLTKTQTGTIQLDDDENDNDDGVSYENSELEPIEVGEMDVCSGDYESELGTVPELALSRTEELIQSVKNEPADRNVILNESGSMFEESQELTEVELSRYPKLNTELPAELLSAMHSDLESDWRIRKSGITSESLGHEEKSSSSQNIEETEIKYMLVTKVCQRMLPSKTTVNHYTTLKEWLLKSNVVSSLVAKINPDSKFIHHLRLCAEVVSTLILPNKVDYSLMYTFANSLLNEQSLDSIPVFDALMDIINNGAIHSSTKCQQVLANYFFRCLLSDPESEATSFFLDIICRSSLLGEDITAFKPILSLAFECEQEVHEDILVQILRNGVVSETFSTGEADSDTMETDFLTKVNCAIKRLHDDGKSQCPFIIMVVDLMEDSFSHDIENMDKTNDELSGLVEYAIVSQTILAEHEFDLQFLVACGFFKAFTKYLSKGLNSPNEKLFEYVNALLAKKGDSSTKRTMDCYILKCLCHGKLSGHVTKEMNSMAEKVSNLKLVHTPVTDDLRDCSIDRCPLLFFLSPTRQKDLSMLIDRDNVDYLSCVKSLVDDIPSKEDGLLILLAYAERFLYSPKRYQVLDDKIKIDAAEISKQASKTTLDNKHEQFLKCLLGTDEFRFVYLEQSEQSSQGDCLLNTFLISLFSLCFVHGVKEDQTLFQLCLNVPCKLEGHFLPGYPDTDEKEPFRSPLHYLSTYATNVGVCKFTTCKCQHRIVILQPFAENLTCPVCSNILHVVDNSLKIQETFETTSTGFTTGNIKQTCYAIRNLSPLSCQILFLLMKGCLIGSLALGYEISEHLENMLGIPAVDIHQALLTDSGMHWENIAKLLGVDGYSVGIFLQTILLHTQELVFEKSGKMTSPSERLSWEEDFEKSVQSVVENRFVYQREMVRHYRFLSNESNVLEDALLEVNENTEESFSTIFREKGRPSFNNFVSELYPLRERFPLLCLILSRDSELHLPAHIKPIIQWHMAVASTTNYAMRKHECLNMTVTDFVQHTGDKEKTEMLRRRFGQLQKSWKYLKQNLQSRITDDMVQLHGDLKMKECTIFTEECKLYKLLLHLVEIQNDILDNILALTESCDAVNFLMRSENMAMVPYINIADVTEMHLLQLEDSNLNWLELLEKKSQCDTGYGQGQKVWYDFKSIERLLVQRLIPGKAYIILSTLPRIVFTDELYKNYVTLSNDIKLKVKQKPLGSDMLNTLDLKQKGDPRMCKELMIQVGMIMTLLNQTGGDPSKCLIDYIEEMKNVLTKKFSEDLLPNPVSGIKLGHIVALHEKLEEINAETIIDALDKKYCIDLEDDQKNIFEAMVKTNEILANYVLRACKRFINRCLSLGEADADRPLLYHIVESSFWPEGVLSGKCLSLGDHEEQLVDVIPLTVLVKHIYHMVNLIETELEKMREGSLKMSNMARSWQSSRQMIPLPKKVVKQKAVSKSRKTFGW